MRKQIDKRCKYPDAIVLLFNLKAVYHKATFELVAMSVGRAVARCAEFGPLYFMYQVGFAHLAGCYTKPFGFLPYLGHGHCG